MDGRLTLAVVTAVALTGCGAAMLDNSPSEEPTATLTPAPVAESDVKANTTVDTPEHNLPWLRNGRLNLEQLRQAHRAFLSERSYEWKLVYNESSESFPDKRFTQRAVVVDDDYLIEQRGDITPPVETIFVNETGGYLRAVENDKTTTGFISDPVKIHDQIPSGQLIKQYLTDVNLSASARERNGQTYYQLHGATSRRSTFSGLRQRITNYQVTAYVTPEGFVASMAVSYDRVSTEDRKTVSFRFDYTKLDEAKIEKPDWVGRVEQSPPAVGSDNATDAAPVT